MLTLVYKEKGHHFDEAVTIKFKYNANYVETIKKLTNRWYIPNTKEWEIPLSELPKLIELFGVDTLIFDKILKDKIKQNNGEVAEKLEVKKDYSNIMPIFNMPFKTKPFPHQIEGFNAGLTYNSLLIGDEQGLGKTWQAINISVARKLRGEATKCLIVCGVNSVKYNWSKEIAIHSDEQSVVFDGKSTQERAEQIKAWKDSDIYFGIINIESLRKDEIVSQLNGIDFLVLDEAHKAKNGQSQQGKAIRKLQAKYKIALTGTPIMNKPDELWNILYWLGAETKNFYAFRRTYCIMGGFGGYQVVGYKNLDNLNRKLKSVMLRRKKDEVLDLPPKIHQIEYIELTPKQRDLYNQIRIGLISQIEELAISPNPLAQLIRLRQVTGGLIGEDNPKLERLVEIVDEVVSSGKKIIIFSQWEKMAEIVKEKLREYNPAYITGKVDNRQNEVDKFQNDDNCNVIIGTIGAMGTGLTLNKASYVVFLDKAWTPADNEQAEDRSHRIGTTGTVNILSLVAKDTIDETIEQILVEKKDIFNKVVDGHFTIENKKELLKELLEL